MREGWLQWTRRLWVLLALNSIVLFVMTQVVALDLLEAPSPRIQMGLAETGLSLAAYGAFFFISTTIVFLVFFVVALLIIVRRPHDGFAIFTSIFLLTYGTATAYPQFVEFFQFYLHPPVWYAIPSLIENLVSWPLLVTFLSVYPDGKFVPRWLWMTCVYGALLTSGWVIFQSQFSDLSNPVAIFGAVSVVVLCAASLYAQIWRYRNHMSSVQRQQTRWFMYALAIFFATSILAVALPFFVTPTNLPIAGASIWGDIATTFSTLLFIVLPLAVGIAILRYRLWDIDILIRKTLTYATVAVLLALVYFACVILLQQLFAQVTGQRSEATTVISTLAIAALFVPLRDRIQDLVDRRFYRKKYDAQQVLSDFANTVRDETNLETLTSRLLQVVNDTMQPTSASIWLNRNAGENSYTAASKQTAQGK